MKRHLGFGLLLAIALVVLFPGLVLRGEILFERDLHQMLYGQYASIARIVAEGSLPVWDPWPGLGQPLLANPSAQVLYPPTWLCLLFEPGRAYTLFVVLHLLVAAFATRALAQRLGASGLASAAAGLLFVLSGPFLSLANLWHHLAGAALLPVVLVAADTARAQPTLRNAVRLGGAAGLQALAGSFDMCVLTALVAAGLWAVRLQDDKDPARPSSWARLAGVAGVSALVALALTAGLLLPALDLWSSSARAALPESVRTFWSLHPALLVQVLLPVFPGTLALPAALRNALLDGREPFLASLYLGLSTLPLSAAGLTSGPRRLALFLGGLALASTAVALGRYGVVYPALLDFFPALGSLRYPVKATIALALAWVLLAALGLDALRRVRPSRALAAGLGLAAAALVTVRVVFGDATSALVSPLVAAAGLAVAATLVAGRAPLARGALTALVGFAGLDLLVAHRSLHPTAPAERFAQPPEIVAHLPASGFVRVQTWDYLARILGKTYRRAAPEIPRPGSLGEVPAALATALARRDFLSPPTAARFALHGAFERDFLGLLPRGQRQLGLFFQLSEETPAVVRLLQLGGVTHAVSLHREGLEDLDLVATQTSPFVGPVHLSRVPDPLPRAFVVDGVRVQDGLPALRLLTDPRFDPRREVVVPEGMERRPDPDLRADLRMALWKPDQQRFEVDTAAPVHLVVLEAWDPGWVVRLDGRAVPLVRANTAFRAVALPAGRHQVEMAYRPKGLAPGLLATGATAILVAGALLTRAEKGGAS